MDKIKNKNDGFFTSWESTINAASFITATTFLTGSRLISWINVSNGEILLTSFLNGCSVLFADKIANSLGVETTFSKTILTLAALASGTFASPYIATSFFDTQVTQITLSAAYQICFINLCIKVTTHAFYKIYQSAYPSAPQELGEQRTHLENGGWDQLDFSSQLAWNKKWTKEGEPPMLFTKHLAAGRIENEELLLIEKIHSKDTSQAFSEFLKKQNRYPQNRKYRCSDLPTLDFSLSKEAICKLSKQEIAWYHLAFTLDKSSAQTLSSDTKAAFSKRFYDLGFPVPNEHLYHELNLKLAREFTRLEPFEISWYYLYFARKNWQNLTFKEQVKFNLIFISENYAIFPIIYHGNETLDGLETNAIIFINHYYDDNIAEWMSLSDLSKKKLIALFQSIDPTFRIKIKALPSLPENAKHVLQIQGEHLKVYHYLFTADEEFSNRFSPDIHAAFEKIFSEAKLTIPKTVRAQAKIEHLSWQKKLMIHAIAISIIPILSYIGLTLATSFNSTKGNFNG